MLTSWRPQGASVLKRADDGLRTRDLQLGKLALYQLSYVRAEKHSTTRDMALPLRRGPTREDRNGPRATAARGGSLLRGAKVASAGGCRCVSRGAA